MTEFEVVREHALRAMSEPRSRFVNVMLSRRTAEDLEEALGDWRAGRLDEMLLMLPARTDTRWWQECPQTAVAFVRGRVRFPGQRSAAPFPSALVYLGPHPELFAGAVEPITGPVWRPLR